MKTNAVRALDRLGIRYELRSYEVDAGDLSAPTVAAKIGLPVEQVFKTLLVQGPKVLEVFAVIPGDASLDLKALARLAGDRRMALVPLRDVRRLTGYLRGGVTALAAKKDLPVFIDETLELFERISVSAGVRGCQQPLEELGEWPRAEYRVSNRGERSPQCGALWATNNKELRQETRFAGPGEVFQRAVKCCCLPPTISPRPRA